MRWARNVACLEKKKNACTFFLWGKLQDKSNFEGQGKQGSIALELTLNIEDGKTKTGFIWLRTEISSGLL